MAAVNKAILVGYLGADPQFTTVNGIAVAQFTLATTARWRTRDGQDRERTEWHTVVIWRRLAEIAQEFLHKGSLAYIEGTLQTDSWKDDGCGKLHHRTRVIGHRLQLLDRREARLDDVLAQAGPEPLEAPPLVVEDSDDLPF